MDAIFVIEPGTKVLGILQAEDADNQTFGMSYQQPDGRVVMKFRHRDRNGRKTVTEVTSGESPIGAEKSIRSPDKTWSPAYSSWPAQGFCQSF